MDTFLIPLHGVAHGGPHFFFLPLLGALLLAFVLFRLIRTGRVGPVRLDRPAGAGGAGGGAATGRPGDARRPRWGRTAEDDALATLKHRLATGDITPEEYLARSQVLRRPNTEN